MNDKVDINQYRKKCYVENGSIPIEEQKRKEHIAKTKYLGWYRLRYLSTYYPEELIEGKTYDLNNKKHPTGRKSKFDSDEERREAQKEYSRKYYREYRARVRKNKLLECKS